MKAPTGSDRELLAFEHGPPDGDVPEILDVNVVRVGFQDGEIGLFAPAERADLILQAVRDAGLVGMGGAAFPTHIKLALNPERPIDTLVVNGAVAPYFEATTSLLRLRLL